MPGIFGAYFKADNRDLKALSSDMASAMDFEEQLRCFTEINEEQCLIMGRCHLGILGKDDGFHIDDERRRFVFHGEIYRGACSDGDVAYWAQTYAKEGTSLFGNTEGIFHAAVFDPVAGKLSLVTDKFGLQPLYYSILPDGIVFAGEVKSLLAVPGIDKTPDFASFADFFHYGQILGEKTLFKEIRLLPPGSVLRFDLQSGDVSIEKYFSLSSLFSNGDQSGKAYTETDAIELFKKAIDRRADTHLENLGLSLSGGLDSRAILAGLKEKAQGLHTYTLGLSGCADERLAGRMAQLAGTRHEFIPLQADYIASFRDMAKGMIRLSDGMYHPHESTEMLALDYFKRAPFKVLLRGHGGEIAKASLAYPIMVTPEAEVMKKSGDILRFIFQSTNLVLRDIDPKLIFRPEFQDIITESPWLSLKEDTGDVADRLKPADVCIYHYINEHIRRQVIASLEIFRTVIEMRLPFLDEDFLSALLSLPVRSRWAGEIHRKHVAACMPELMGVPDSNTGAPLHAGPLRLFVTDKFNSLMKKLSVKGFRHYTEFQKWHREGFLENSRAIVFSDRTESRGLYQMDHLKSIFDAHASGAKDYGHILGTIVGLELWYRAFVDPV